MDTTSLLICDDLEQKIPLVVEKSKLINFNEYFKKLLSNDFKDSIQKEITINVPNAIVSKDIIENVFHEKLNDIHYLHQYIKCLDFWNMEFDPKWLSGLNVCENDFAIILDIADIVGYNNDILFFTSKNLPKDYDLKMFPEELIMEIIIHLEGYNEKVNHIDIISRNGYANILEWLKNSGHHFKYTQDSIDWASQNNHINVLEWFKESGLQFKYSDNAIDWASGKGYIGVLEWFKKSNLKCMFTNYAIVLASKNNHVGILNWFREFGYHFKYAAFAINLARANGHTAVIEWFENIGIESSDIHNLIVVPDYLSQ